MLIIFLELRKVFENKKEKTRARRRKMNFAMFKKFYVKNILSGL
jgi:hypothetical protein